MADSLPDEIISEILSPALKVPEHMFSKISSKSPFAKWTVSSSAALLVCKAWLRVATPLLYHVVIIRSKAQARALEDALAKNPELGRFIKKLRIEGGFGTSMQQILKSAPNATDIFLSLQIHSSDSVSGLAVGLPLINPTRVIIFDDQDNLLRNKAVLGLIDVLEGCVKKWTNLNMLFLPYSTVSSSRESLVMALCACENLKILSLPVPHPNLVPLLTQIAQFHALEAIEIRKKAKTKIKLPASIDPKLESLLRFVEPPTKPPTRIYRLTARPPADPAFRPLSSAPSDTVDLIWARILFFAMLALEPRTKNANLQRAHDYQVNTKRLRFLLVSKTFHRLALPYLYRSPILRGRTLQRFADSLAAAPALGLHVRELDIREHPDLTPASAIALFTHTARLRRLVGDGRLWIEWAAFRALADAAGDTLEELSGITLRAPAAPDSPAVFAQLAALRSCTWQRMYSAQPVPFFDEAEAVPFEALPALEFLSIKTPEALPILSQMELPSLRRVAMHLRSDLDAAPPFPDAAFLRAHGDKIWSLRVDKATLGTGADYTSVLELCPNMSALTCRVSSEDDYDLGHSELPAGWKHAYLTKLVVSKYAGQNKSREERAWAEFFPTLDVALTHLPALREIRVMACQWPTTEHAIAKSLWVKWAENLLQKGVKLTDKAGMEWHPRLKMARR
ncbi:hypothetical protein C8R44DRAFT_887683 [Mycena epipterygia]|nr:hypothetical protein C8R44DRAFT_887683 [Mycena epipterygia]